MTMKRILFAAALFAALDAAAQLPAEIRIDKRSLDNYYVASSSGESVPVSSFVEVVDTVGVEYVSQFNLYRSISLTVTPAARASTTTVMQEITRTAGEVLPDCGSICALLTAASGVQPTYIGKPNRNMVDVISAQTGVPNAQICCVGDRIYTDIAVAVNAGAQSVLVMSGETDEAILKASDVQPKYVLRDVAELAQILRGGATA